MDKKNQDQQSVTEGVPSHMAVICDGNRRWAERHGWEVFRGHERAVNQVFEPLIDHAAAQGIKYLTFWIFSTENWQRAPKEVDFLMDLFRSFFDRQVSELDKKNIRVNMIGRLADFAQDIQERIVDGVEKTQHNTGLTVTMAMNYGGRDELVRAMQAIAGKVAAGEYQAADINRDLISEHLDTAGVVLAGEVKRAKLPDPDLIVRTSGEQRLSGFMSWQSEYSEFIFPDFHFPEFTPEKLDEVLAEFAKRKRRFGG